MTAFCGTFAGQDTWVHWTVNPCILESVSSVLLICIAALVLYFQGRRIMLLRKRQHQGSERTPACAIAFYFSIVALAASHGALLIAAIVYYIRGASRDPYELFNQSASAVVWLCALVRFRAFLTVCGAAYLGTGVMLIPYGDWLSTPESTSINVKTVKS